MTTNMKEIFKSTVEGDTTTNFEAKPPKEKYRLTLAKLAETMDNFKKIYPIEQDNNSHIE